MGIKLPRIRTKEDIINLTLEYGFLPFFENDIEGFSIEEACPDIWELPEGPWEWKGPIIRTGAVAYGKLFGKKAGYISIEWLPDFANWRRDGYDLDARYDDGLCQYKDKELYDCVSEKGPLLTDEVKRELGYAKDGKKGFETVITRLQMQTYLVVGDFIYRVDKHGKTYGWGVARYDTPERIYGAELVRGGYVRGPEESFERIFEHLQKKLPEVSEKKIIKFIG